MKKPKNIKEARELADKYDSITLEQIKAVGQDYLRAGFRFGKDLAGPLTGFGCLSTCTLCIAVGKKFYSGSCDTCIYFDGRSLPCLDRSSKKTYQRIWFAPTPTKLRNAFRARAKYIRERLKQWD